LKNLFRQLFVIHLFVYSHIFVTVTALF